MIPLLHNIILGLVGLVVLSGGMRLGIWLVDAHYPKTYGEIEKRKK
jgi:formate hydrogenlyase subunit 3/multisubunit Na+/H+ antiporter MnhD subunit